MKRFLGIALTGTLLAAVSLAAQSPKGWMVRADRSTSASDPDGAGAIKFVTMGTGFHATNPQAAVYWNPANTGTGDFTFHSSDVSVDLNGDSTPDAAHLVTLAIPNASSRSIQAPDSRVSRPERKRAGDARPRASAPPRRRMVGRSSGYSPAFPRTPSVPKRRDID